MKGEQWTESTSVPHTVPTRSLIEVIAMEEMLNGEWKVILPIEDWWEDMNLLSGDQFWMMEEYFRFGKWRAE